MAAPVTIQVNNLGGELLCAVDAKEDWDVFLVHQAIFGETGIQVERQTLILGTRTLAWKVKVGDLARKVTSQTLTLTLVQEEAPLQRKVQILRLVQTGETPFEAFPGGMTTELTWTVKRFLEEVHDRLVEATEKELILGYFDAGQLRLMSKTRAGERAQETDVLAKDFHAGPLTVKVYPRDIQERVTNVSAAAVVRVRNRLQDLWDKVEVLMLDMDDDAIDTVGRHLEIDKILQVIEEQIEREWPGWTEEQDRGSIPMRGGRVTQQADPVETVWKSVLEVLEKLKQKQPLSVRDIADKLRGELEKH